jgi:hypothetical protein
MLRWTGSLGFTAFGGLASSLWTHLRSYCHHFRKCSSTDRMRSTNRFGSTADIPTLQRGVRSIILWWQITMLSGMNHSLNGLMARRSPYPRWRLHFFPRRLLVGLQLKVIKLLYMVTWSLKTCSPAAPGKRLRFTISNMLDLVSGSAIWPSSSHAPFH